MDLKTHKQKLLSTDVDFRREYYSYDLAFEIGQMILEVRSKLGLTQKQLAEKVFTKQPSIARLESGVSLPSLTFLNQIALSIGAKLKVDFEFESEFNTTSETLSMKDEFSFAGPSITPQLIKTYTPTRSLQNYSYSIV